jgi:hypothetical protein
MRSPLFIRLLLIVALLFAQTGGLVHGISHTIEEQSQDQSLPHDKLCDLCATYAQLGSALGSHVIQFSVIKQATTLTDDALHTLATVSTFNAYASRAPPYSA